MDKSFEGNSSNALILSRHSYLMILSFSFSDDIGSTRSFSSKKHPNIKKGDMKYKIFVLESIFSKESLEECCLFPSFRPIPFVLFGWLISPHICVIRQRT